MSCSTWAQPCTIMFRLNHPTSLSWWDRHRGKVPHPQAISQLSRRVMRVHRNVRVLLASACLLGGPIPSTQTETDSLIWTEPWTYTAVLHIRHQGRHQNTYSTLRLYFSGVRHFSPCPSRAGVPSCKPALTSQSFPRLGTPLCHHEQSPSSWRLSWEKPL